MGTPTSDKFNEDQRQIQTLTFNARQMLCSINLGRIVDGNQKDVEIAQRAIQRYEAFVEKAEEYLRARA